MSECGYEVGEEVIVACDIIEDACDDHPDLLIGKKGEKFTVVAVDQIYPVTLEDSKKRRFGVELHEIKKLAQKPDESR